MPFIYSFKTIPSEEERNAMLERLDAMLVVPSHLEAKDGENDDNGGSLMMLNLMTYSRSTRRT